MKLKNIKKIDLTCNELDEDASKYYDFEQNIFEYIAFEAHLAKNFSFSEYILKRTEEYSIISNSIQLTKFKNKKIANELTNRIISDEKFNKYYLFFNLNTILFERINKFFGNISLNINRHNSK